MSHAVAIDIGGTFTDLVAFNRSGERVVYTKSPTTYGDFAEGILDCFRKAGLVLADVDVIHHGTTLVINTLIQRSGGRTALVTTRGFRDVLEIARGNRPAPLDLYYQRDEPLIPRERRFEISERIASDGAIIEALDLAELEELAQRLRDARIESVALFFLNSYVNPTHEEQAARALRAALPGVFITASTESSREWYEYERTSTACANAYVGPQVIAYMRHLEHRLKAEGFHGTLHMMGSNGGVLSVERTCRQPIALVESGPVGGAIGAGIYASALGFSNAISFDMGGTTAKCTLVEDGRFSVDSVYYVDGYVKGFPIKSPVIEIQEVGSGGGSIAWLDAQNRLHVGPQSAGSSPGPACYGRGGEQPTVTDANLVLGRLNADNFLGGELHLELEAARAALSRIAQPLGYVGEEGLVRMASGVVAIATVIMAGVIRRISIDHGRDPRDFALIAYGGGGPLHACSLARELSIPMVIIPVEPGNFSAVGMTLAEARVDDVRTYSSRMGEAAVTAMNALFGQMEADGANALQRDFQSPVARFERHVEMRYVGQRHNIKVLVAHDADAVQMRQAFERQYKSRYGHADALAAVEIQALHLSAFAQIDHPDIGRLARPHADSVASSRRVHFDADSGAIETGVHQRIALAPGFSATGPAVIEEYGSTTLVWPGDWFEIGPLFEIRVHCNVVKGQSHAA